MSRLTLVSSTLVALAAGVALAPAEAATVRLTAAGASVHGDNGRLNGTIKAPGVSAGASIGGFDLTDATTSGGGLLGDFTAWCLDIYANLRLPSDYRISDAPFAVAPLSESQVRSIGALFDTAYATLDIQSNVQSAGFQLALWEIVNETGAYDLNSGDFYVTGTASGAAATFAEGLLTNLGGPATARHRVIFLESERMPRSQNLVTVELAPVPLPASGLLLVLGAAAFGFVRRRR